MNHPLRQGSRVGIGNWNHIYPIIIILTTGSARISLILIFIRRVGLDNLDQNIQLLRQGGMEPRLDGRHNLHRPLHKSKRGAYRGLLIRVPNLQISNRSKPAPLFHHSPQQGSKHLRGFFVRKEGNSVLDGARRNVNVPKFARHQRRTIALNPQTTSLQTSREISQRPSIHKLPKNGRGRLGNTTNQMNQTKGIEPKPRNIPILNEVHPLQFQRIVLAPVPIDRQHQTTLAINSDDIRQGNTCRFAVLALIFKPFNVQFDVHFKELVAIISISLSLARQFVLTLLNLTDLRHGLGQIHVPIEP